MTKKQAIAEDGRPRCRLCSKDEDMPVHMERTGLDTGSLQPPATMTIRCEACGRKEQRLHRMMLDTHCQCGGRLSVERDPIQRFVRFKCPRCGDTVRVNEFEDPGPYEFRMPDEDSELAMPVEATG